MAYRVENSGQSETCLKIVQRTNKSTLYIFGRIFLVREKCVNVNGSRALN